MRKLLHVSLFILPFAISGCSFTVNAAMCDQIRTDPNAVTNADLELLKHVTNIFDPQNSQETIKNTTNMEHPDDFHCNIL